MLATCRLIHCSYHKCLTSYFANVMGALAARSWRLARGYHHFRSRLDEFEARAGEFDVVSINNHALDLERLRADVRITRFVRDPRDLVVSGYFYHKRGAEAWCTIVDPTPDDWRGVNGRIPPSMPPGHSLTSWLQSLDAEAGLMAELEFRRYHLESMALWPDDDPRICLLRYEDYLGREKALFRAVLGHYGLPWLDRFRGARMAGRRALSAGRRGGRHVRNPTPGQWREHFTPALIEAFGARHGHLLDKYGYAAD
ncbi:MAG: hypothetical protein ACU85V_07480 [Gammaproteobacteria bacterium]